MTPTEIRLFKEQVIKEYLSSQQKPQKNQFYDFLKKLKSITPLNIVIGVTACILLIWLSDWEKLFILLISGVIWITLVSTLLSVFVKTK